MIEQYLTPEERVKARKKVFQDYIDVAQPAQEERNTADRNSLKRGAMAQTSALAQTASPQLQGLGTLGVLNTAASASAQMVPQQAAAQDAMNLAGAQQQQEIAKAKSEQAVRNTGAALESDAQRMARLVADKAFQEGMSAKQLLFHENAALADYSLEQLAKDYELGRTNKVELQTLKNQLTERATQKKYAADEALAQALGEFRKDLAAGNVERAKQRILAAMKAQEEAAKDAARASGIGSIISGISGIGGAAAVKAVTPSPTAGGAAK